LLRWITTRDKNRGYAGFMADPIKNGAALYVLALFVIFATEIKGAVDKWTS